MPTRSVRLSVYLLGAIVVAAGIGAASFSFFNRPGTLEAGAASATDKEARLVGDMLETLADEVRTRRQERRDADDDFDRRVDRQLNAGRINVLLYGYGESHEPPSTDRVVIGSVTIVSINVEQYDIDLVSLTHDIRAPEVERYLMANGSFDGKAIRIDQAYPVGGFALMRETLEDATGLAIDFQLAFHDSFVVHFVDEIFGTISVDVPKDFEANPFYLYGVKHDARHFPQGRHQMDGLMVIQYIKTVPLVPGGGYYGRELEHNARKHLVFKALLDSLSAKPAQASYWICCAFF